MRKWRNAEVVITGLSRKQIVSESLHVGSNPTFSATNFLFNCCVTLHIEKISHTYRIDNKSEKTQREITL